MVIRYLAELLPREFKSYDIAFPGLGNNKPPAAGNEWMHCLQRKNKFFKVQSQFALVSQAPSILNNVSNEILVL